MRNLINIILLLTLFISCKNDLIINIDTQKINDKKVKANITTNFPENTVLSITAERIYQRKNNNNFYGGTLYYSRELAVKNGMIEFSFDIQDKEWIDDYNQHREFEKSNKELTEIDFKSIQDTIEISVFYTPIFKQDDNVKKVLGEKGENINGKGTMKVEYHKIFRATEKIYSKFER